MGLGVRGVGLDGAGRRVEPLPAKESRLVGGSGEVGADRVSMGQTSPGARELGVALDRPL